MNYEGLKERIKEREKQCGKEVSELKIRYAKGNARFSEGDIVVDDCGDLYRLLKPKTIIACSRPTLVHNAIALRKSDRMPKERQHDICVLDSRIVKKIDCVIK